MQLSLPLIAALFLAAHIIARELGVRSPKNLDEAWGLGGTTAIALLATVTLHWPLSHFVLQPFQLPFLDTLIAVLLIATSASLIETRLQARMPGFFPIDGTLHTHVLVGAFILALPTIQDKSLSIADAILQALLSGIGATLLIAAFHAVRAHSIDAPAPLRGAPIDFISAGLLVAALAGIASVF